MFVSLYFKNVIFFGSFSIYLPPCYILGSFVGIGEEVAMLSSVLNGLSTLLTYSIRFPNISIKISLYYYEFFRLEIHPPGGRKIAQRQSLNFKQSEYNLFFK